MSSRGNGAPAVCPEFEAVLIDEAVGELAPEEARRFTEHTMACAACREARAQMRRSLLVTRSLLVPEPSEEYWEAFRPRLHERIRTSQQGIPLSDIRRKLAAVQGAPPPPAANAPVAAPSPAPPRPARAITRLPIALAIAAAVALVVIAPALLDRGGPPPGVAQAPGSLPATPGTEELAAVREVLDPDPASELDLFVDELSSEEAALIDSWLGRELAS